MKATKTNRAKDGSIGKSGKAGDKAKVTLASLHARVRRVEERIQRLSSADRGAAAAVDVRPLTFMLNAGNAPRIAQLVLQDTGEELVLTPTSASKSSKPRQSKQPIPVGIDTFGDPGQRAVIDVTNVTAASTPIVTSVLTGNSAKDATTIVTDW